MDLRVLESIQDMRSYRSSAQGRVGLVPTMGALHAGHAELLKRLRDRCDQLVLSIFVNPTQFGPKEDFSKYPRTFESDLAIARKCGVDAVFFPTSDAIYPPGYSTYVDEERLTRPLCGEVRPGHFRGVTTVVLKLFNIVQPDIAYFGLKDAQQFFVLHKMTKDLNLDISVEGVGTVREPSGLALSSRNRYLNSEELACAPLMSQILKDAGRKLEDGAPIETTLVEIKTALMAAGFETQYAECLELPDLSQTSSTADAGKPCLIAVAARLGTTRLIDNIILRPELLSALGIKIQV